MPLNPFSSSAEIPGLSSGYAFIPRRSLVPILSLSAERKSEDCFHQLQSRILNSRGSVKGLSLPIRFHAISVRGIFHPVVLSFQADSFFLGVVRLDTLNCTDPPAAP